MNDAEDFGMTAMIGFGLVLAIFWVITSVSFWETKDPSADAVDRLL